MKTVHAIDGPAKGRTVQVSENCGRFTYADGGKWVQYDVCAFAQGARVAYIGVSGSQPSSTEVIMSLREKGAW